MPAHYLGFDADLTLWIKQRTTAGLAESTSKAWATIVRAVANELGVRPAELDRESLPTFLARRRAQDRPIKTADAYGRAMNAWLNYLETDAIPEAWATNNAPDLHPVLGAWVLSLMTVGAPSYAGYRDSREQAKTSEHVTARRKARVVQECMQMTDGNEKPLDHPRQITKKHVERLLVASDQRNRARRGKEIHPKTRNFKLLALQQYAKWESEQRGKMKDPTRGIARGDHGRKDNAMPTGPRAVADEAGVMTLIRAALSDEAHPTDPERRRIGGIMVIILTAMADCALRISDAIRLDGSPDALEVQPARFDEYGTVIEPERFYCWLARRKGSQGLPVRVAINEGLYRKLRARGAPLVEPKWLRQSGGNLYGYHKVVAWAKSHGVAKFPTHALRRMAAVRKYYATSGDVSAVADLLGHAEEQTTWIYLASLRGRVAGLPESTFTEAAEELRRLPQIPPITGTDARVEDAASIHRLNG